MEATTYKINKIGIEIEAEYAYSLKDKIKQLHLGSFKGDGSINNCEDQKARRDRGDNQCANDNEADNCFMSELGVGRTYSTSELITRPIKILKSGRPAKKFKQLFKVLIDGYKKRHFHFNKSTGLHLHVSFLPAKNPSILWTKNFVNYLVNFWSKNFPAMLEKRAGNNYCKIEINDRDIFTCDRYQAVNFISAMERHGTLEIRIFDTTNPAMMKKYLLGTIKAIQHYLKVKKNYIVPIKRIKNFLRPDCLTDKTEQIVLSAKTADNLFNDDYRYNYV